MKNLLDFIVHDATIQKERSDYYNNLKWQFALENSNIGLWDFEAKTSVVFFSKETKKILGFEDHEIGSSAQEWNDRVHPEDKEKYFQDFKDHLNGDNPNYRNEHRVKCKDGSYKWILDRGKVIERDNKGKPTRVIGTYEDITKQREREEFLANSINIITEQNNRLKNFAHIVSHNLKEHAGNVENILSFYAESKNDKEKEEFISYLNVVSESLSKTINNLNTTVSIQANKNNQSQKINLFNAINNIIELLDSDIKSNTTKINLYVNKSIVLYSNPVYIESVFQNLISNALKYRHTERNPEITIISEETENEVVLRFSDNGIGIDLEKFGNDVFGLYRTFHSNENAEGVGLYLTKTQIESLGGTIEIDSKVDVGTTFTITLPNKKNPT